MSKGKETDTRLSRRKAWQAAGITAGAFLLGGFTSRAAAPSPVAGDESSPPEWKPVTLNPQEVAASAYEYYSQGGCMYASFKAICISMARATAHTNPPLSKTIFQFPFRLAQYGHGGLGGQGSLCGVVNGACAALSLFVSEKSTLDAMIAELCGYYETAQLPLFVPQTEESEFDPMPRSVAGSILCHISQTSWCRESGQSPFSTIRRERCKRLSADIAAKAVEILNCYITNTEVELKPLNKNTRYCLDCHSKEGPVKNIAAKTTCTPCHDMKDHY